MAAYELAQLNIAQMRTPLDAPEMVDFVANLDRINALADSAPGFVWRLQEEDGNATAIRPFGDRSRIRSIGVCGGAGSVPMGGAGVRLRRAIISIRRCTGLLMPHGRQVLLNRLR